MLMRDDDRFDVVDVDSLERIDIDVLLVDQSLSASGGVNRITGSVGNGNDVVDVALLAVFDM